MKNSFSLQWSRWAYTMYDSYNKRNKAVAHVTEDMWLKATNFETNLKGKTVVDLGCGSGRFLEIMVKYGAEKIVGIDDSEAIKIAEKEYEHNYNVEVYKRDVLSTNIADNLFDAAISIGVLHHTHKPLRGVREAFRLLKPGGWFAIVVYPKDSYYDSLSVRLFRKALRLIPLPAYTSAFLYSYYMGYVINPMCLVIPKSSSIVRKFLPFCPHEDCRWSTLGTFDSLTPRYNSTHTYYEVWDWLREAGFVNIEPTTVGWKGYKPLPFNNTEREGLLKEIERLKSIIEKEQNKPVYHTDSDFDQ